MERILEKARQLSLFKLSQRLPKYNRFLFQEIIKNDSRVIGIYGARGVGKTTLMLQILKTLNLSIREALYISCDHPLFLDINLFEFLEEFYKKGGKIIFLDEIHKVKNFQNHLKSAYDFLDLKIIFSGSSALSITNADFARRFSMYKLPILSLREYIKLAYNISFNSFNLEDILAYHEKISEEIVKNLGDEKILKIFEEYNDNGAYPFYFEDREKYLDRLNETINTALYYDLGELYKINPEKLHVLKKLLATICVSKPLELSIEKLTKLMGITKSTLYNYLEYLSRAELIIHIIHETKRFKAIRKPDKLYLANTNLFNALCIEKDKGTVRESFFASMVSFRHSIYYTEKIDFLVDEKYYFEVGGKAKDTLQIRNIKNAFLAIDDIEIGFKNKIPLWLFGFLY